MLREAQVAASLVHPNVVAVYDVGVEDGAPFIAMELVSGRPLREFVGDSAVPLATRIRWLVDVARALAAAHRAGIVHRDVKPENVIVTDEGVVKILDFGIARRTSQSIPAASAPAALTAAGMVLGTPQYMAPEQIRSEAIDGRADQFAWGVVAFELLTGRALWAGPTDPLRAIASILTSVPPPTHSVASNVPPAVSQVVEQTLAKRPADRFATMDDVADALEAAAAGVTPSPASGSARGTGARAGPAVRSAPTAPGLEPDGARAQALLIRVAVGALACGLVVGGVVFARDRASRAGTMATAAAAWKRGAVAVLPFQNGTGRSEDEWLRIGLADALQTKLAALGGIDLVTLPPGSPPLDAHTAASRGAVVVVSGTFQKIGERLQIAARAETLEEHPRTIAAAERRGSISDVFELEDAIATALGAKLDSGAHSAADAGGAVSAAGTRNLEALEALARGRALLASGQVAEAMRSFDHAVRADPLYRDARASLNRLRAEFHHFLVKDDGAVVETIAETLKGDPTAPWQLSTDTGSLTRAWDFAGNPLRVERVSAAGNQATFQVLGAGGEPGDAHGIVYELESASKDNASAGLGVLFHAVAKNTSGEATFVVQLPRGARALAVIPTPAETHDDDAGVVLVLREARSAFVPFAWSVVHASDPAAIARFRGDRPSERAQWIVAADARMARHGWAADLGRVADVADVCAATRPSGSVAAAKTVLARIEAAPADYGPFFVARGRFCVAAAEGDDRAAAADLEAALTAEERPAPLVAETYEDAIEWCLERKRVDDMARLVRLELHEAPWWNDGPFHSRAARGDEEASLRSLLAREPSNIAASYDLALELYHDKRFEDAARVLERADEFLGGVYVSDLRARIAVARGKPGEAAAELRKVVMYYPMTWAWIAHAVLLASAGRGDEAFAFVASQAQHAEVQPPFFWALRYVVGVLPHAASYAEAIEKIVRQAQESRYGEPYRLERMIDILEVASLSLDPEAPALTHALFERFKHMLHDTSPEVCNEACLRTLGAHLCRVRGLASAERGWVERVSGQPCQ
jgi:serine/threonine-protein kinase